MSRSIACLAYAAGRLALGVEAAGQVGDRLLEALRDGREVLLVAGDQRRVGLGGEVVGKVKRAGSQGVHVISSDLRSLAALERGKAPVVPRLGPFPADRGGQLVVAIAAPRPRILSQTSGLGQRLCGTTRVLPQAPRCAIR